VAEAPRVDVASTSGIARPATSCHGLSRAMPPTDYATILAIIAPVFAMIGAGTFARWRGWMRPEAEESLLRIVVNLLFPCLVFSTTLGNKALHEAGNIVLPPLVGFITTGIGFIFGWYAGRLLGLSRGRGLRTFAFAVGVYNYGYIPIPLIDRLFGAETLGVLLVHNVGCDLIIWTVGIILLAGASWRDAWRKALNPPSISIAIALLLNFVGAGEHAPAPLMSAVGALGLCAVPIGLVVTGGSLYENLTRPRELWEPRIIPASLVLRLLLVPILFLVAAKWLPLSIELKRIMVIQAAMPAGVGPLIIARHYGGHPLTAAQVIFATTVVGLFVIPWWIRFGLAWIG